MKIGKVLLNFLLLILFSFLFVSCENVFGSDDSSQSDQEIIDEPLNQDGGISFDFTGAKAVGAADINESRGIRGSEDAFGLVKVLEDGSIEMAMEAPENVWLPKVQFIAKKPGDSKDLFVSFENSIQYWVDGHEDADTGEWIDGYDVMIGSFLHIKEDGSYTSIIDEENGRVRNNSWWGEEGYVPVDFDSDGNLYFVFEKWGSGDTINTLYQYNTTTGETTALTAPLSGYEYSNFQVSPDGTKLFVKGSRYSNGTTNNFMRMYPTSDMTHPKTVYYSSNSDVWVRGFKVAPTSDYVILNGWNIRGINGLIKASIDSDNNITYEPLYGSSDSNSYFNPRFDEWYNDWEDKTYYNGFFDEVNKWDTYVIMKSDLGICYARLDDAIRTSDNETTYISVYESLDDVLSNNYSNQKNFKFTKTYANTELKWVTDQATLSVIETNHGALSEMPSNEKDQLIIGYVKRSWTNGTETAEFVKLNNQEVLNAFVTQSQSSYFTWNEHWFTNDTKTILDTDKIMSYVQKYFIYDVYFGYNSKTGADAFKDYLAAAPYTQSAIFGSTYDSNFLLDSYFYNDGTTTKATRLEKWKSDNNATWLNFSDISTLFFDSNSALWGVVGGGNWGSNIKPKPIQLTNSQGKKELKLVSALDNSSAVGYLMAGDYLYFREAVLDSEGYETGYHYLKRIKYNDSTPVIEDVLANITINGQKVNGEIEIIDFSVGGDWLYFTAVHSINVVGGKINLNTFDFTPFAEGYVLKNIEVY